MRPSGSGTFETLPSGKVRCRIGKTWGPAERNRTEAVRSAQAKLELSALGSTGSREPLMIAAFKLVENLEGLSPKTKEGSAVLARKLEDHPIGAVELERVTTGDVQVWIESLGV